MSAVEGDGNTPWGWFLVDFAEHGIHHIPTHDSGLHYQSLECPCRPVIDESFIYQHNSFDGREDFENNIRKPS